MEEENKGPTRDDAPPQEEIKDAGKTVADESKAAAAKTDDKKTLDKAVNKAKALAAETNITETTCKLPAVLKRCEDDHNACLDKCDLSESYALILFILSIPFLGSISRLCYMCCSKTEQSPVWILKAWIWLSLWIGLTYMIFIGWIWDIIFCW